MRLEIHWPQFEFSSTIAEQVARTGAPAVDSDALAESQFRGQIEEGGCGGGAGTVSIKGKTYDQIIGEIYKAVLDDAEGSVEKAAARLGLARSTFYYRLKEAGISLKKGKG